MLQLSAETAIMTCFSKPCQAQCLYSFSAFCFDIRFRITSQHSPKNRFLRSLAVISERAILTCFTKHRQAPQTLFILPAVCRQPPLSRKAAASSEAHDYSTPLTTSDLVFGKNDQRSAGAAPP